MKYKAIIETDDFEDFEFFEDGCGKYIHGIDAGSVNGEWIALYFTECEQEPCDDAISRQAVLDEINRIGVKGFETYNDYSQLYDFVDTLLLVKPQEKTGHWIKQTLSVKPFGEDTVLCDQCAFMTDKDSMYNYCPNCGAKMEE